MVTKPEFVDMVSNAYQSLYDFVRLRNHPIAQMLLPDDDVEHKERGWQVHHMLLDAIEELYPGPAAPAFSKEWRRHRLMVLRYVEAIDPQAIADQLAISRRQYYREHGSAMETIAALLWERVDHNGPEPAPISIPAAPNTSATQADAMQRELARISLNDPYANLPEVVEGVLAVLDRVLDHYDIAVDMHLPGEIPVVSVGNNLLRQVLLGALGYLIEHLVPRRIVIEAQIEDTAVCLDLRASEITTDCDPAADTAYLENLQAMLQMGSAEIDLTIRKPDTRVFTLELPLEYDWTVLAVDDNEDTLALYKRCLIPNRYRVITTTSAHTVVAMARELQPDVVLLDLMMPDHDGWDLLQQLSNHPDTAQLPIMICSVLKQQQLALSLGAAAYLAKPFTEQTLLKALDDLLNTR